TVTGHQFQLLETVTDHQFQLLGTVTDHQFQLLGTVTGTVPPLALFQTFGKSIYEAEWLTNSNGPQIVLLKIDGARAKKDAMFYVELSRHPHIVQTFGLVDDASSENTNSVMLLQEWAPEGNLFEYIQDRSTVLNEIVLCEIFIQIADAMSFLTHNHIIHGDLACRNILVFRFDEMDSKYNLVKLTDFGLSRSSSIYNAVACGSSTVMTIVPVRYAAPEILSEKRPEAYTEKSDIYSMGVLMWEAFSKGLVPWNEIEKDEDVAIKIINGERLKRPLVCNDENWSIIMKCLSKLSKDRPNFIDLKRSLTELQFQFLNIKKSSILIDIPNTTTTTMSNECKTAETLLKVNTTQCLEKENERIKCKARDIANQPFIEKIPCEYCQDLFNLDKHNAHEIDQRVLCGSAQEIYALTVKLYRFYISDINWLISASSTTKNAAVESKFTHTIHSIFDDTVGSLEDTILIKNLPENVTIGELDLLFSLAGEIKCYKTGKRQICIHSKSVNGTKRATITYVDRQSASNAVDQFNDEYADLFDKTIQVQIKKNKRKN
ncbi:unnamed protein product, partial [Didymodactylos carnosus]